MQYTPQLIPTRDSLGNVHQVAVTYDRDARTYVGTIEAGRPRNMVSGRSRKPIAALGEADTVSGAVACTIANLNSRKA